MKKSCSGTPECKKNKIMNNSSRILVVTPEYPYPPNDGHKVRVLNLIRNLNSSLKVTWLFFGEDAELASQKLCNIQLGTTCEQIEIVPKDTLKPIKLHANYVKKIFFPHVLTLGRPVFSPLMKDYINQEIASSKYDFIIFSGFSMFVYADLEILKQLSYVVDAVDSPSVLLRSYFYSAKTVKEKMRSMFNWLWAKRYESLHFSKAKNMIFISDIDANTVKKSCPQSRIWVISNGVDVDYFQSNSQVTCIPYALLFTGVMSYPPNNAAMIFFIKEIFPLVKERIMNTSLMIAGPDPLPELIDLTKDDPQIQLLGYVDDIRTVFKKAQVYISPLVSGAGVKNKILEAWAMALPIVATTISCAGLKVENEVNALVSDKPVLFAEQVCRLLLDEKLRSKLGVNGKKTVVRNYSWRAKSKELENCIAEVSDCNGQ